LEHILETQQLFPARREDLFPFFADAANLERITPPELAFRIVTPLPIDMAEGTRIAYRLKLFGIPFGWKTLISRWEPSSAFVDEQTSGPYRQWIHLHTFEEVAGGTLMTDRVAYRLPLGPLGDLVHPLVRRQLTRIFGFRRKALEEIFGTLDGEGSGSA